MARVISDSCISCGSCAAQCPVSAISQGDAHYEIDPNTCIDCGSCEAQCPVGAMNTCIDCGSCEAQCPVGAISEA